jgi:hypothetical protein
MARERNEFAPPASHIQPPPAFQQHPSMRRGTAGSMPLGQPTKRFAGAFTGIPSSPGSSDIGEAAGGQGQSAAAQGGYSSVGGAPAPTATDSGQATFTAVAPVGSGSATAGQGTGPFTPAPGAVTGPPGTAVTGSYLGQPTRGFTPGTTVTSSGIPSTADVHSGVFVE